MTASASMEARTISDVLRTHGAAARERMRPRFDAAHLDYPPRSITLLALKQERRVEVWAQGGASPHLVHTYPILAASGVAGPKLRRGDLQVPEGAYGVLWLNPNSSYHLSMKVDYPNAFDRRRARAEGRTDLGGDIFIHGRDVSIGCIAVGDPAIEELFVLASDVGLPRVKVLIAPRDLRQHAGRDAAPTGSPWLEELYAALRREMAALSVR
ncbi:MAG TPA: L,D-transpeptidase family protein [Vicinamibacteria bacterium]|nr:L,D-transpeptidase family protein [Vicinamibacteria bacterium]